MLILIQSDPRKSHRPAEAVRVAAGLAALGSLSIKVCFRQSAALILSESTNVLIDGAVICRHLPTLAAHAKAIYAEASPFLFGNAPIPYKRITLIDLKKISQNEKHILRF